MWSVHDLIFFCTAEQKKKVERKYAVCVLTIDAKTRIQLKLNE